jgi:hypothetical protein
MLLLADSVKRWMYLAMGVLLLEIVSGCKNINLSLETNKIYLPEWVSVCTFSLEKNQVNLTMESSIVGPRPQCK